MSFLIVMTIGLAGLFLMALPGLHRQTHVGDSAPRTPGLRMADCVWDTGRADTRRSGQRPPWARRGESRSARATSSGTCNIGRRGRESRYPGQTDAGRPQAFRLLPSPRAIFSVMTMFGAFGYALVAGLQFAPRAGRASRPDSRLWDRIFRRAPLWNLMFQLPGAAVQFPWHAAFLRGQGGYAFS